MAIRGYVTQPPAGTPYAPTELTATPGDEEVEISWLPSTNVRYGCVDEDGQESFSPEPRSGETCHRYHPYYYSYQVSTTSDFSGVGWNPANERERAKGSNYVRFIAVPNLTNGQTYYFRVRAETGQGNVSVPSLSALTTPVAATPDPSLSAPDNVRAEAGNGQVTLRWDEVANATAYQYRIKSGDGSYGYWTDAIHRGVVQTPARDRWTITGLSNGTRYTFQVRVKRIATPTSYSAASSEVSATPRVPASTPVPSPGGVDAPPANLRVIQGNGQVTLTWDPVPGAIRYEYRQKSTGGSYGGWMSLGPSAPFTVTGLSNGTTYTFQVRAVVVGAPAEVSAAPGAQTEGTAGSSPTPAPTPAPVTVAPAALANFDVLVTLSDVILTWSAVSNATGYQVQYEHAEGWFSTDPSDPSPSVFTSGTSAVLGSQLGYAEYMFRVRAKYNGGAQLGPWSETRAAFRY